jgi:hypothetical protein
MDDNKNDELIKNDESKIKLMISIYLKSALRTLCKKITELNNNEKIIDEALYLSICKNVWDVSTASKE